MFTKTITVTVEAPPSAVYAFASNPENLPRWAPSFVLSIAPVNGKWVASTPIGELAIRFVPLNDLGVLDHFVTAPDGVEVYVPMRVFANGRGSEIIFTLFQSPEMSDEQFEADARMVESDLLTLKKLLEPKPVPPPANLPDGTNRRDVTRGREVLIVLKEDQPTGKLTSGTVKDILTSSPNHPRGIKVRLTDGRVGRVQKIVR